MKLIETIRRVLLSQSTGAARKPQSQGLHAQLTSIQEELQGYAARLTAVQEALLPKNLPSLPEFQAAVSYQPRQVVGGDWYGVVPFVSPESHVARHIAIAVGDVCGHDVSATVIMAVVLGILRCYRALPASPADVMRHLNARLCEMSLPNGFTTAFIGFLSLDDLSLTYSTAGHPRPLVRSPNAVARPLTAAAGLPLGLFPEATWQDAREPLAPGSLLCLYTDGVTETAGPGGTFYGSHRLSEMVDNGGNGPLAIIESIEADLRRHQGPAPQGDDRTILVVKAGDKQSTGIGQWTPQ